MFRWLKRILDNWYPEEISSNENVEERDEFYIPRERVIYRYFDGEKVIREDPMVLIRKISEVAPDLQVDMTLAQSKSKMSNQGYDKAVEKIRKIFELKSLKEGGVTEAEAYDEYWKFVVFCDSVKKNMNDTVTLRETISQNTTESIKKEQEKKQTMKPSLDTSSIKEDKKIETLT